MTKKESKDKRIGDILDAAVAEFVDKGYENTSMESIALRSGLTKGGLYYHFEGKDDILIRANERFLEPIQAMMTEATAARSPSKGLKKYLHSYLTYWTAHPRELAFVFLTMTKVIANESFQNAYRGYTKPMVDFFEGLYRRGIEGGEFQPLDCRAAAVTLMAALDGIAGYLVIDGELSRKRTIEDFCIHYVDEFMEDSHER